MILRSPAVNELDDIEENYQGITGVFQLCILLYHWEN